MKNGRFFYQNYKKSSFISSYAFKTSSDDYYIMDYSIVNPFQDNPSINFVSDGSYDSSKGYEKKGAFYYFQLIIVQVKYKETVRTLYYLFDSIGLTISSKYKYNK